MQHNPDSGAPRERKKHWPSLRRPVSSRLNPPVIDRSRNSNLSSLPDRSPSNLSTPFPSLRPALCSYSRERKGQEKEEEKLVLPSVNIYVRPGIFEARARSPQRHRPKSPPGHRTSIRSHKTGYGSTTGPIVAVAAVATLERKRSRVDSRPQDLTFSLTPPREGENHLPAAFVAELLGRISGPPVTDSGHR